MRPSATRPALESLDAAICRVHERIETMQRLIDKSKAAGWPTDLPEETVRSLVELSATYQAVRAALSRQPHCQC
jgi:hypothetical protein